MDRDETYRQQTEHCIAWDPVIAYVGTSKAPWSVMFMIHSREK
jgi:hypothetical protein